MAGSWDSARRVAPPALARLDRGTGMYSPPGAPFSTAAMGNIQKKLMVRSEGGRRSRRGRTPRPRAEQQGDLRETATAGTGDNHCPEEPRAADSPSGLKSRGNELFRGGQFAEAAAQYSVAIAQLEPTGRRASVTGAGPHSFLLTKGTVNNTWNAEPVIARQVCTGLCPTFPVWRVRGQLLGSSAG